MKAIILSLLVLTIFAKLEFFDQKPLIEQINSLGVSWKAGHNKYFDGMTRD